MAPDRLPALQSFFSQFAAHPWLQKNRERWRQISRADWDNSHSASLIELIDSATLFLEREMQRRAYPEDLLNLHQQLFLEMESLIADQTADERHRFIVVIPVADRPQHLQSCLDSLNVLCHRFGYGGFMHQKYTKITALIADDSKEPGNKARNKQIQQQFTQQGLKTIYFGQSEQRQLLDDLTNTQQWNLTSILGDHPTDQFHHKGASITRNLSYLKLKQLLSDEAATLIWFVDSDQEFQVNTPSHRDGLFSINYFHRLDRIFSTTNTLVLTGKVVGDPPVSPAVMAGNFLQDVLGFLSDIARLESEHACQFHQQQIEEAGDAAYHDMADLFGFHAEQETFRFQCNLQGKHNLLACFNNFSQLLKRFFDGVHLTRQNIYTNPPDATVLTPARTLYTGNYILSPQALDYFIPFATLKLRMAGPQLGRIMKAELGNRFVSANLPLLHKRTQEMTGESEFRPGIDKGREGIDISEEFERQFFGDIMLFSLQALVASGYPQRPMSVKQIEQILLDTESSLLDRYHQMQQEIMIKLDRLKQQIEDRNHWWWHNPDAANAIENFQRFMQNMALNFSEDSSGNGMISSASHRQQRRDQILQALCSYSEDRDNWRQALASIN
ncbi:MAG: hypothetical protein PVJ68_05245 [Candidatus Thiodiazotropha sp.]|jgi:hypothetical protein